MDRGKPAVVCVAHSIVPNPSRDWRERVSRIGRHPCGKRVAHRSAVPGEEHSSHETFPQTLSVALVLINAIVVSDDHEITGGLVELGLTTKCWRPL
jgi:hypothetical protein